MEKKEDFGPGTDDELERDGGDRRAILERLLAKFDEDIDAGRIRVSVGDLARILAMRTVTEEETAKVIEVRWIEQEPEESDGG